MAELSCASSLGLATPPGPPSSSLTLPHPSLAPRASWRGVFLTGAPSLGAPSLSVPSLAPRAREGVCLVATTPSLTPRATQRGFLAGAPSLSVPSLMPRAREGVYLVTAPSLTPRAREGVYLVATAPSCCRPLPRAKSGGALQSVFQLDGMCSLTM